MVITTEYEEKERTDILLNHRERNVEEITRNLLKRERGCGKEETTLERKGRKNIIE